MDNDKLAALLKTATPDAWGWWVDLPADGPTFLEKPVAINVQTRPFRLKSQPPKVDADERRLLSMIGECLEAVLGKAERRFNRSTWGKHAVGHLASSKIWLNCEFRASDGENTWTLVVSRDDAPSFGYHIEFDGLKITRLWAGD